VTFQPGIIQVKTYFIIQEHEGSRWHLYENRPLREDEIPEGRACRYEPKRLGLFDDYVDAHKTYSELHRRELKQGFDNG